MPRTARRGRARTLAAGLWPTFGLRAAPAPRCDEPRSPGAASATVVASVVGSVLTTHTPAVGRQTVVLSGTDTSIVTVAYGSVPLQLALRMFAEGLTQPVFLTAPPGDARQFIVERGGRRL